MSSLLQRAPPDLYSPGPEKNGGKVALGMTRPTFLKRFLCARPCAQHYNELSLSCSQQGHKVGAILTPQLKDEDAEGKRVICLSSQISFRPSQDSDWVDPVPKLRAFVRPPPHNHLHRLCCIQSALPAFPETPLQFMCFRVRQRGVPLPGTSTLHTKVPAMCRWPASRLPPPPLPPLIELRFLSIMFTSVINMLGPIPSH